MNAFLGEAITEGEALRDLLDCYSSEGGAALGAVGRLFRDGGYRRLAFAGMGSSYCAPFAVLDQLIGNGILATAQTAHRLAQSRAALVTADTMVVAISKSGATREVLDLVDGATVGTRTVALVNQPESTLEGRCAVVVPLRAGSETQIASKSYLCTLAVLNLMATELAGAQRQAVFGPMRKIAQWACEYLANATQNSEPLVAAMGGATHVDLLASGASFSTAYKSALVLREVPRVMAAAIDCADYAHGWVKAIHPGYVAIVLAPDYEAIAARAVDQVLGRGGRVILLTGSAVAQRDGLIVHRHPPVAERLAPLPQAVICDAMIGAMADRMPR